MTALAKFRNVPKLNPDQLFPNLLSVPLKHTYHCFVGSMVAVDTATGYGRPAFAGTGLAIVGIAEADADATLAANDGDVKAQVRTGCFKMNQDSSIAQANCWSLCYALDDQTVTLTDAGETLSVAGTIVQVDTDGVWILMGVEFGHTKSSPKMQSGTVTLVAGTKTINTGIELSTTSVVMFSRKTEGGTTTTTVMYDAPGASRVIGAPGTATLVVNAATSADAVNTTDTSTLDYLIVG